MLTGHLAAGILWVLFLVGAIFYTREARHPGVKPLAAWLIFVTVFTVTAFVLFSAAAFLLEATGRTALLSRPVPSVFFILIVFVPALLLARWQLRKRPITARRP